VLPLKEGAIGEAVSDVRRRLSVLGFDASADPPGEYGPATGAAVEAFQHRRGLPVDGVCGHYTWATLVEAGFRLGDRFLYRRTPVLRGDDVAELQQRLGALGFDSGRVDGIFGDRTSVALGEFQRNSGLPVDGILGGTTLLELLRVRGRHQEPQPVQTVRALEQLRRAPATLTGRHVGIGEVGGMGAAVAALRRQLVVTGARVTSLHHPDDSAHAEQANAGDVDVYVGLRLRPDRPGCSSAYWAGYRNESPGGRRLAELVQSEVPPALDVPDLGANGMSLALLRETRMPAVVVEVGPATVVVERGAALAGALARTLVLWSRSSWD
jgi:N-acetylmuramoyl-L-alanine amidase